MYFYIAIYLAIGLNFMLYMSLTNTTSFDYISREGAAHQIRVLLVSLTIFTLLYPLFIMYFIFKLVDMYLFCGDDFYLTDATYFSDSCEFDFGDELSDEDLY